ncbi:PrsW family intramembrane metalloprotease [Patescibacteria group bacterium]|nr:PrsW family intramembrane metalloprotease [Patescibacteria group bacterium]MBU1727840.1 PrsW family intramembrane metalloprotease [Patescibacteria group bacterium]
MINDPKIIIIALIGGIIPALFWLWFWLKEAQENQEPKGLLAVCFILGMISVIFVLPIQKFIQANIDLHQLKVISWASVEEIIKYLVVLAIIYKTRYSHRPIDWPIFMITAALGFAALENTLFLIKPLSLNQATVSLLTGQLRFLGSTLLHAVSSGIVGIALGLSLNMELLGRRIFLFFGLILAIALHSIFNFFIIENNGSNFLRVFAFLWVVTIIIMLLFEKLRRMNKKFNIAY